MAVYRSLAETGGGWVSNGRGEEIHPLGEAAVCQSDSQSMTSVYGRVSV